MNSLQKIQFELNAPKDKYNDFGKFKYRSCEGILEALKPLLQKYDCTLFLTDEVVERCGRCYVEATATLHDAEGHTYVSSASAQDSGQKTGMVAAQVTGAASSYARKYALNGLFLIDDAKDPDTDEYATMNAQQKAYTKAAPKQAITMQPQKTPQELAREYLQKNKAALQYYLGLPQYSHVGELDMFTSSEMLAIYNHLKQNKRL